METLELRNPDGKRASNVISFQGEVPWKIFEVVMVWLALFLVITQLSIFDVFFVVYGNEGDHQLDFVRYTKKLAERSERSEHNEHTHANAKKENAESWAWINCSRLRQYALTDPYDMRYFYYWLAPDILAVLAMSIFPLYYTSRLFKIFKLRTIKKETVLIPPFRFAWISWLIYSSVFVTKIAVCHQTFMRVLQYYEHCGASRVFDLNTFVLMLILSTLIFFLITASHHTYNNVLQSWLVTLIDTVTFNILDAVHFLQIVFAETTAETMIQHPGPEYIIVILSCLNFMLPTISLVRVSRLIETSGQETQAIEDIVENVEDLITSECSDFPPPPAESARAAVKKRRRVRRIASFFETDFYNLVFLLVVNLPLFLIRCYLWHVIKLELSVFLIKNIIQIILAVQNIISGCIKQRRIK